MLEPLEEELTAAARAEGLVCVVPVGLLATGRAVRSAELLERRASRPAGHEDLTESVSAEVAIELSTYRHESLHPKNGARVNAVPLYPRTGVRVSV